MIDLPTDIGPREANPRELDFGGFLEPGTGAEVQRLNRLGNRTALDVTLPPLRPDRALVWISRLRRGQKEGVRWEYPLLGLDPGSPGNVVVDGAGQSGRILTVRGVTPRYAFKEGWPFSIEIAGQHFLYFVDNQVIAGADGKATLQISPIIRKQPADGDRLHVARPMIEGLLVGDDLSWTVDVSRFTGLQFEIRERR